MAATLSDVLRRAIDDSGLTIYRIAKDCGVHFSVVARFHHGERTLTLDTADKIAERLDLVLVPRSELKKARGKK